MELVRGLHNLRSAHRGNAVTIGNFDGVHRGHQEMLRVLRARAAALGVPATVLAFEPTPREFFAKDAPPARLTRFREKFEALAAYGVDRFVCLRFDERMRSVTPERFVSEVLVGGLGARYLLVGPDFRFARERSGTVETLRELCPPAGCVVEEMPPVRIDGQRVSSSLVRAALAEGDLDRAARLLGRPYRMSGKVIDGAKLGRRLGYPTANVRLHRRAIPFTGIFAVRVSGAGLEQAPAVANLGTRPAVNGKEPLLEAHVFDFDGDLYGRYLHVDFIARLRDEAWFPNLDALVEQMHKDAAEARAILQARSATTG